MPQSQLHYLMKVSLMYIKVGIGPFLFGSFMSDTNFAIHCCIINTFAAYTIGASIEAGTSKYIQKYLLDVINCPCP